MKTAIISIDSILEISKTREINPDAIDKLNRDIDLFYTGRKKENDLDKRIEDNNERSLELDI